MLAVNIIFSVLILALLAGGLYAYLQAFYSGGSKEKINEYFKKNESYQAAKESLNALISKVDERPCEDVYTESYDKLLLHARYYHVKDGAPVQILMHGYKGNPSRDMCGAHALAMSLGHNALLIDQRGCGKSEGKTVTFGVKERRDAQSWARYIANRFGSDTPIFLVGVSMGGATALMASDLDLGSGFCGVVADCPYSSPKAIIKKVCADRGMPSIIYPIVAFGALLYGQFNISKSSAIRSVKKSRVPIIILHGKQDGFVPYEMAEEIFSSATGEKELHSFEAADHGTSYITEPERYEAAVTEFLEKCLNSRPRVDNNNENNTKEN